MFVAAGKSAVPVCRAVEKLLLLPPFLAATTARRCSLGARRGTDKRHQPAFFVVGGGCPIPAPAASRPSPTSAPALVLIRHEVRRDVQALETDAALQLLVWWYPSVRDARRYDDVPHTL